MSWKSVLLDLRRACPKLDADRLMTDPHRPTTCKVRVMSPAHQMVRIDAESRANVAAEIEEAIAAAIKANLPAADVVVVSDYARGRCKDLIFACQSKWRKRPSEGLDHYPKRNRLTGAAMVGVLGDTVLAAQTRKDDANLLLCGKLPPGGTADLPDNLLRRFLCRPGFLSHRRSFNGYDGPEILVT